MSDTHLRVGSHMEIAVPGLTAPSPTQGCESALPVLHRQVCVSTAGAADPLTGPPGEIPCAKNAQKQPVISSNIP